MCCIALGQYELAEEYLVNTFTTFKEEQLIIKVKCNLSLLYVEKNFSELAIQNSGNPIVDIEKDYKTIFQIVRSFTKAETDLISAPMF